jgi:DmsE family decaheme c-type cytochrome
MSDSRRALWVLSVFAWVLAWPSPSASGQAAAEINVSDCRTCHEAQVKTLEATRHFSVESRCSDCHQGVPEHLKSVLDKGDPGPIIRIKKQAVQETNDACGSCHDKGKPAHFQGGPHDRRGVACASCHSVHGFKSEKGLFKTARESETCFSCHPSVRAKMNRVSHHPLREGVMQCSACHDVHGSNPKLIAADWVNETCYQCHAEKRGPFLWEHASARDNCLNCHEPHGSNHRPLLITKPPYLCQRCHLNTLHAATMYDARDTPRGSAPTAFGTGRACTNCHRSIHGTNAPSGTILVR